MKRRDERIDLLRIDVVELAHGRLNERLVRVNVDDENQSVHLLDLLHRRLGRKRALDDAVRVELRACRQRFARILWLRRLTERFRSTERRRRARLLHDLRVRAFGNFDGRFLRSCHLLWLR